MEDIVKGLQSAQTACVNRLKSLLTMDNHVAMISYYFPLIYGYNLELSKKVYPIYVYKNYKRIKTGDVLLNSFRFGNHETLVSGTTLEEKVLEILRAIYPNMIYEWDHNSTTSDMFVFTILNGDNDNGVDDGEDGNDSDEEKPREDRSEKVPLILPVRPEPTDTLLERLVSVVARERQACVEKFKDVLTIENKETLFEEYFERIHGYHVYINLMTDGLEENQICFNIGNDNTWGVDEKSPLEKVLDLLKIVYPNLNKNSIEYHYSDDNDQYYHTFGTDELPFPADNKDKNNGEEVEEDNLEEDIDENFDYVARR